MTATALEATTPTEKEAPEFVTLSIVHAEVHAASQSRKMFAFARQVVSKQEVQSPPRMKGAVNEAIVILDDESGSDTESQPCSSDASSDASTDPDLTPEKSCANGLRGRGGRGRGRGAKAKAKAKTRTQAKAKASPKTRPTQKKPAATATAAKSRASKRKPCAEAEPVLDAPDTEDGATVSEKARKAAQLAVEMLQNSKPKRQSQSRSFPAALPAEFEDS